MTKEDFWKEFNEMFNKNITLVNDNNEYVVSWAFWWGLTVGILYDKLSELDRIDVLLELSRIMSGDNLLRVKNERAGD